MVQTQPTQFYINDIPREVLILIFKLVSKSTYGSLIATCKGWNSTMKEIVNPAEAENKAIRWAAAAGKIHCVKPLLRDKRVDPR